MAYTVRKLLESEQFPKMKLLCGEKGLDLEVKGIRIIEIEDMERYLTGGEILITSFQVYLSCSDREVEQHFEELANADKTIYTQKNNIESRNGYYISEKLELHKSEQWSSLFLPIIGTIKETHVKVKGTNLYFYKDLIPSIAFFDENKVLISAKYEAIMPNVPVEIPDNSAYVVMNSLSGTFSVEFFSILNQIKNLEKTHGNGNLLSKKCDGEEIKGYGLYTNEQPFYQHENSSVIRYALEKNKKYVFPSGNSSYKLVNGNPENYSMYFNSNGKNEFVNIFGAEFCYVDRIDHDVKKYGRELYEDTITKNSFTK